MSPVVYVTDLTYERFDPADLFDLAFLMRSERHRLGAVCLSDPAGGGARVVDALSLRAGGERTIVEGAEGLLAALGDEPVSLVVTGGFSLVDAVRRAQPERFRQKVTRMFLVGGQANDYASRIERLPIDPRLRERNPERFSAGGDLRIDDPASFGALLTSGEGVIWLPRDICLWRYAAPQILEDSGPLAAFLLRELYHAHLGAVADRYAAAEAPALLCALPALLLAASPDPFSWLRLFRAETARVACDDVGRIVAIDPKSQAPNLFVVVAIDSQALGKMLTATLRPRAPDPAGSAASSRPASSDPP